MTLRVVYRSGVFLPQNECRLEDGTEGLVMVESGTSQPPLITAPEERHRLLAAVVERMRKNPLPPGSPKLTRDQMHERS